MPQKRARAPRRAVHWREERQLRRLIEDAPVAIGISQRGRMTYANRKLAELFGFESVDKLLGAPAGRLIAPRFRKTVLSYARRRARGLPAPPEYDVIGVREDGGEFILHIASTAIRLESGAASFSYFTDVTGVRSAEEALRRSETTFRALFENAPIAIGIAVRGVQTFSNRKLVELFGFRSERELAGTPVLDRIAPRHRKLVQGYLERRAKGLPAPTDYEVVGLRADGSEFHMQVSAAAVRIEKEMASLAYFKDVTEACRAEAELRASEARFRFLVEHGQSLITGFDAEGKTVYYGPANEALTGRKPEERLGRRPWDLLHPEDADVAKALFKKALENPGTPLLFMFRLMHGDGSWRYMEGVVTNHLDEPSVRMVVVNARDVTQRIRAEENARRSERREP